MQQRSPLHFRNISVNIRDKKILDDVSGFVLPGQLCAILGPSGAGKSTLLDVLACRPSPDAKVDGQVLMRKSVATKQLAASICGYVRQEDIILHSCTVRETLRYATRLKMGGALETSILDERVENLINELGLVKCADTLVGSVLIRGISGGEKKRLSVALELITKPEILFLDEPTTGLDSSTAFDLIRTLRDSTSTNHWTTICTIHQPRIEIFELFDKIILMTEGSIVYHGPSKGAVEFFGGYNFVCPKYENPAVYYLELLQTDRGAGVVGIPTETRAEMKIRCSLVVLSEIEQSMQDESDLAGLQIITSQENAPDTNFPVVSNSERESPVAASFLSQCAILSVRAFKHSYRDELIAVATIGQYIFLAIFFGALYWDVDNTQQGAQDRSTVLFLCVSIVGSIPMFSVVAYYPSERVVFNRERATNLYRASAYYIALTLSTVPLQVICVMLFSIILYFMVGLADSAEQFFIFYGVMLLVAFVSEAIGLAISAAAPTFDLGNGVASLIYMLWLMFSGFYVSSRNIQDVFIWLRYSSYMKFTFEALMANDFKDLEFTCEETTCMIPDENIYIPNYNVTVNARDVYTCLSTCIYPTGEVFLESNDLQELSIGENVAIVIGMTVFSKLVSYLILRHIVIGRS